MLIRAIFLKVIFLTHTALAQTALIDGNSLETGDAFFGSYKQIYFCELIKDNNCLNEIDPKELHMDEKIRLVELALHRPHHLDSNTRTVIKPIPGIIRDNLRSLYQKHSRAEFALEDLYSSINQFGNETIVFTFDKFWRGYGMDNVWYGFAWVYDVSNSKLYSGYSQYNVK